MKNKIILYKGYEILHRHVFNNVWFSAWKGQNKVGCYPLTSALERRRGICGYEIRKDNRFIDWDNPLSKSEKEFLIGN